MSESRMLRASEAARYIGVSLATWKRLRAARQIPAPAWSDGQRGARPSIVRWDLTHLDLWLDAGRPGELEFAGLLAAEKRKAR